MRWQVRKTSPKKNTVSGSIAELDHLPLQRLYRSHAA
jgi:hypothetical protein